MDEMVVLKKIPFTFPPDEPSPKRKANDNSENSSSRTSQKKRKSGKESEIQGALALIELARN